MNPVLIDEAGGIIAGHGRVTAARQLGWSAVPTLRFSHLTVSEKRAYVLADNKLAEKAGWDREILAIELQGLIDLEFNIELTGFETAELDLIFEELQRHKIIRLRMLASPTSKTRSSALREIFISWVSID